MAAAALGTLELAVVKDVCICTHYSPIFARPQTSIMSEYISNLIHSPQVGPLLPQLLQLMVTRPRDDLLRSMNTCKAPCCCYCQKASAEGTCQVKVKLFMLCAWVMQLWQEQVHLMCPSSNCQSQADMDHRNNLVFEQSMIEIWENTLPWYKRRVADRRKWSARFGRNSMYGDQSLLTFINYEMHEEFDSPNNVKVKEHSVALIRSGLKTAAGFPGWHLTDPYDIPLFRDRCEDD